MKNFRFILLSTALLALSAQAQVFLIDFNNTANANGYPGGSSAWNAYNAPANVNGSVISDSTTSSALGITLSHSGTMSDSSNGNSNTFDNPTGGPSWVTTDGSLANTAAAADYFFTSTGSTTSFTVIYGNLVEGTEVNLDVWMSRNGSANSDGFYEYSLDGGSTWSGFTVLQKDGSLASARGWDSNDTQSQSFKAEIDGNDNARYMNVSSAIITSDKTLSVRVSDASSGRWSGLGAMQLSLVPEPTTYAMLFSLAVFGVVYLRRQKR